MLAVVIVGCGSTPKHKAAITPTPVAVTPSPSPTPPPPPALPRPVLVQIENYPAARPQTGLSGAKVVYEYITEGGITRFTAIYFGAMPAVLGPNRSAREVSVKLMELYQGVLIYSGASYYVRNLLYHSGGLGRFFNPDTSGADFYYRIASRQAPHNLYLNTSLMHQAIVAKGWTGTVGYRLWPAGSFSGQPTASFNLALSGFEYVSWHWDSQLGRWMRVDQGAAFIGAGSGHQLGAAVVVVQHVPIVNLGYVEDVNGQPGLGFGIQGSGPAQVFANGMEAQATWTQGASGPPVFTYANGQTVDFPPGPVWIELTSPGNNPQVTP